MGECGPDAVPSKELRAASALSGLIRCRSQRSHDGLVVSFALRSPYAMVCAGTFIERLYYHLNTVCVVLADE